MITILIQSILLASSGILSVGSITLVILLLVSERGWKNGLAYMLGYYISYSMLGVAVILAGYQQTENSTQGPGIAISIIMIVLGTLLLYLALRNWRKPINESYSQPKIISIVDQITPVKALGFGVLVTVINFKNMALFISALSVVIFSNLQLNEKIIVTLSVAFVFCLSVIIPVFIYVVFPQRANKVLSGIKQILETHSRPIGIWLPLIFGCILLIRGITKLL